MSDRPNIIWSNENLGYEDWQESLAEDYPDLTEAEREALMYELSADHLDDERTNLNIQLSQPILVIADLGRWNGRVMGYKEIPSGNIRDCLYSDTTTALGTWISWGICGAMPSTTTAPTTTSTAHTRTV